jgi:hypothetical protein
LYTTPAKAPRASYIPDVVRMLDQLSPVAPARVRAVLLPIGQIKHARFLSFMERLEAEYAVNLGDISADGRPDRSETDAKDGLADLTIADLPTDMFSPLAFPSGVILYDLITHYPPPSHVALSPFELYREPLVIIAIADGTELEHASFGGYRMSLNNGNSTSVAERNLRQLDQDLEDLRERYPKALVHQLLLFDYIVKKPTGALPEGLVAVPPLADSKRTTIKTIMCDISSLLLAEMETLARSLQALSTVESPAFTQGNGGGYTGASWSVDEVASRRNSVIALPGSRSSSPALGTDGAQSRMSMPAQLRSAPVTPVHSGHPQLPTTFDQIVGPDPRPTPGVHSRFSGFQAGSLRDTSRDRVSVQGFGPGSTSERSRNIGRGRVGIVVGALYLSAGRWGDAIRDLVEAASLAKNNLDHLWHAKALEYILVSMIMLAWAGLDFEIPAICYIEKPPPTFDFLEARGSTVSRHASLKSLITLLPELLDRIVGLYTRAATNTGEALPQYPFAETVIRFSKLLSAVHLAGGTFDDEVLQFLVMGTPLSKNINILAPRLSISPTRTDIAKLVFRAFPQPHSDQLSVIDRATILGGIASVLGSLGYNRKKGIVIRELVSVLVPGLVQARITGAAEMGVHPAAGLASLSPINDNANGAGALDLGEGDIETGVDSVLEMLGRTYGIVTSTSHRAQADSIDDSDEAVIARITHSAAIRLFGARDLKMHILRSCINLSEALPDFHGVIRFTADLLRTAGSGVAPGPRSKDASPTMSREEQVKLSNNISRTLSSARNLGVKNISAEYWDEFLVRGVDLEPLPEIQTPIPHTRNELPGATTVSLAREANPFIYNPFLKKPDTAAQNHLLVAGESAVFKITLQNPYEFDVEIESIKLESHGAEFESSTQKTVIGPYRTQILSISGTPKAPGPLKLTGCIIRVRGCRERRFPIFREPWSPQGDIKIKSIGLASVFKPNDRPTSVGSGPIAAIPAMIPPETTSLELNIIDRQPVVIVKSSTLSQSAVMVLEGERQRFSITLQNLSEDTPVDLLLFSFKDSTQAPLRTAMNNREASAAELYELELIYARKQAIRWVPKSAEKPYIAPGSTATFDMEILGKPGLTSAVVQMDYTYIGIPQDEVPEDFHFFHTRQVSLPITVTVNASIEMTRMDCLPLAGTIPSSLWDKLDSDSADKTELLPDYCLLSLDLRNAWPSPLCVHFEVTNGGILDEEILPGNTSRLLFPIRRIFLSEPAKPVPALDPSRQRQFVVSTGRISAEAERTSREAFWYREEILNILRATWSTKYGSQRKGEIELRGIRLNQRMIEAARIDDIGIDISLSNSTPEYSKHELLTERFSELKFRISNRAANPISPYLRIQPSIRNQPHNASLDLSKKIIFSGTLQQPLPQIPGKESVEISLGLVALCRGEFEVSASVEEARLVDSDGADETGKTRPRADTRTMLDALLGPKERRIWHAREPCILVVRDEDSDDDDDDSDD